MAKGGAILMMLFSTKKDATAWMKSEKLGMKPLRYANGPQAKRKPVKMPLAYKVLAKW